jgi:hypothetical protein
MASRNSLFKKMLVCFMMVAFPILLLLIITPSIVLGADYYVKTPANGGNNSSTGLDWGNAKSTIGAAMSLVSGTANIHVAAGTYNEKVTFPGFDNISLLGGYPAAGGASQDPSVNPTIIDGSGLSTTAAMISIPLKAGGISGYFGIVVDGFTIRNGTRADSGVAGIESYSLGVTITRNIIENNQVTGTGGTAGGIYIFGPLNDNNNGRTIIERNIIRNNSAAAVGGIYLEGASGKAKRYVAYLVNNLIYGNQSTTTDPLWNRGVGGVDIMYPASASIVNCTIADNTAAHPTNAIGGVSITGDSETAGYNGIAAIANSIIRHSSGKDILTASDGTGTLWIAYSNVKDTSIPGTGVIHTDPQFAGPTDYHLTSGSPCKNTANTIGTVLTGALQGSSGLGYLPDVGWKSQGYSDAQVTGSWGDGSHNLKAQWDWYSSGAGKFFGTANSNCTVSSSCTADPSDEQIVSNMATVNASSYSYATLYNYGHDYTPGTRATIFWRGTNGYYGAWRIDAIAYTHHTTPAASDDGKLYGVWYFQVNGGPYFDAGIRTLDLDGKTRPNEAAYDMGAYEYYADPCITQLIKIMENPAPPYYTSIQTAYNAAATDQTIAMQAHSFTENLSLTSPSNINVSLKGGYDCDFALNPGFTTVNTVSGPVTIGNGKVTIENLIIK